jgi:hypothetical protein
MLCPSIVDVRHRSAARLIATPVELEIAKRDRRRLEVCSPVSAQPTGLRF